MRAPSGNSSAASEAASGSLTARRLASTTTRKRSSAGGGSGVTAPLFSAMTVRTAVTFARDRNLEREAVIEERAVLRDALQRSLGDNRADEIISRLAATIERRPFEFLRRTPPEQIHVFLRNESPQTIALVVANLHTVQGEIHEARAAQQHARRVVEGVAPVVHVIGEPRARESPPLIYAGRKVVREPAERQPLLLPKRKAAKNRAQVLCAELNRMGVSGRLHLPLNRDHHPLVFMDGPDRVGQPRAAE